MSEIVVDTSALVAFFVQSEKCHPAARRYAAQHPTAQWIILETVFDEFVTWVRVKVSIKFYQCRAYLACRASVCQYLRY